MGDGGGFFASHPPVGEGREMKKLLLCILLLSQIAAIPDEPGAPPHPVERPAWATERWRDYAAHIVAGESVHNCEDCHLWIACTVVRDVALRGYWEYGLHPGRWHGWKNPRPEHQEAVARAVTRGGCAGVPVCSYLGNVRDYNGWRHGLANEVQSHIIGNEYGAIVCVP